MSTNLFDNTPEETGLAEQLHEVIEYQPANTGQRFLNFLIDNLFMRFILSQVTGYIVGFVMGSLFPEYTMELVYEQQTGDLILIGYILSIFNYTIYYTFCEKLFKGYTLGKLITGTRAIRNDGEELTFKDAILRSLSRLVPFEPFSGFSNNPWHDTWTKTSVIQVRKW